MVRGDRFLTSLPPKAKADAQADADVNAFEKANAWDAKKVTPCHAL